MRLADVSGPFYSADKPFRNWSALPFYQLDLPYPPYVDQAQLEWGIQRAIQQLEQLAAQGYTGVVVDHVAHLVTLSDGELPIQPVESPWVQRALIYRQAFRRLFAAAAALQLAVFVTTDMQWATPSIEAYVGDLQPDHPRLVEVNQQALRELFQYFPEVRGVFVRTGETGGAHDLADYSGHLIYRTPQALRYLIRSLLPVCEQENRLLVVRTWSIGIGELGDLLWSPERYQQVFGDIDSEHLLVSVKHGPSDFFRQLPLNPTIGLPGPRQIVEFQNRREYELFGMVPSSVAEMHTTILRQLARMPQVVGIWAWNGTGGWGGGSAVLGETGWNLWTELNSLVTARVAASPETDPVALVRDWCQHHVGRFASATFAAAVAQAYLDSSRAFEQGWYFAGQRRGPHSLGMMHLPPLLWVWWMRPTAAPLIWAHLAAAIPDLPTQLAAGRQVAEQMASHAAHLAMLASREPQISSTMQFVVESLSYFADVLDLTQRIWQLLLPAAQAAQYADRAAWNRIMAQAPQLQQALGVFSQRWGSRRDFPALEFEELERYIQALGRMPQRLWLGARLAARLVAHLHQSARQPARRTATSVTPSVVSGVLLGWLVGQRRMVPAIMVAGLLSLISSTTVRDQVMRNTLPWLSQRAFLLPSIFFETGPGVSEWTT